MAELAALGTLLAVGAEASAATAAAGAATGAAAAGGATTAAAAGVGLGTALTTATTAASLAGTGLGVAAAAKQGEAAREAGELNAREMERAAAEERAAAARKSEERRIQERRVLSEQRAKAASGGAGTVGGEGYLDLISDTAERGQYLSDLEIYGGEERALGWEGRAAVSRWQGRTAEQAGNIRAGAVVADAGLNWLKGAELETTIPGARPRRGRYF